MYALVLIDIGPRKIDELEWLKLLESLENIDPQRAKNSKIFGGAWLIGLSNGLSFFRNILDMVQENHLSYKVSFFENEPEFIT